MTPFTTLSSSVAPLLRDDVDTDQIIPARYLTVTDRSGLAEGLFAAWREDPSFSLRRSSAPAAEILLVGANFGCGSSREHAPWALLAGGFRCVIGRSFADIFRGNALRNGLLPVALDEPSHGQLERDTRDEPELTVRVDLDARCVRWGERSASFDVDPFARECLLEGTDPMGYLLARADTIRLFEYMRKVSR